VSAVDEQLARERGRVPAAALGAGLGAVLPLGGAIAVSQVLADQPENSPGRLIYFDQHAGELVAFAVLLGLGALALALPLRHLFLATKARRPEMPNVALWCALVGAALFCVGQIVTQVVVVDKAATFATTGDQTYEEAKRVFESGAVRISAAAVLAGQLALGFAFVMISLNAMRVGLLTRFMGVLGIIVGVLFVLPIGGPLPVVQSFWLGALAFLFAGRWPSGLPPAWTTGKAQPWPTQQELREQRERASGAQPQPEPVPATGAEARPRQGSRKRRRKKRR
jgi:hypothetical protein